VCFRGGGLRSDEVSCVSFMGGTQPGQEENAHEVGFVVVGGVPKKWRDAATKGIDRVMAHAKKKNQKKSVGERIPGEKMHEVGLPGAVKKGQNRGSCMKGTEKKGRCKRDILVKKNERGPLEGMVLQTCGSEKGSRRKTLGSCPQAIHGVTWRTFGGRFRKPAKKKLGATARAVPRKERLGTTILKKKQRS